MRNRMVEDCESPGRWIVEQCAALGVTLHQVAKDARIAPSTVYRWSDGQTEPGWGSLKRVQKVIKDYWLSKEERSA